MNVPKIVTQCAEAEGYNSVKWVAKEKGEDIYALSFVDGNNVPLPTGLPTFIGYDGRKCRVISGEDAFSLIDVLFGNE